MIVVCVDAVVRGIGAAEERAVRGQRHGGWRNDVFKEDPFAGELIDVGRGDAAVPVTAQVVGTARVDADQDDMLYVEFGLPPGPPEADNEEA